MWNVNLWRKDILQVLFQCSSGDGAATEVTMHWSAEDPGKIFGVGIRYLSPRLPDCLRAHPASNYPLGTGIIFLILAHPVYKI